MNAERFDRVLREQLDRVENMLSSKASEYADDTDRLHNFRITSALQGITPAQACVALMSKHTVSVFDMVRSGNAYPLDKWDEKITDHINYLILLRAIVTEEDEVDEKLGTGGTV